MVNYIDKKNQLILFCYAITVFIQAMQQTNIINSKLYFNEIVTIIRLGCLIIPVLIEITNKQYKFTIKCILMIFIFGTLVIGNIIFNEASIDLLLILFFAIVCRNIKPSKILSSYAKTIFLLIAIVLVLWKVRLVDDIVIRGNISLGFLYSSFGPNMFLHACFALVAGKYKKIKIKVWILLLAINFWMFYKTTTLSAFIFVCILFISYLIVSLQKDNKTILDNNIISKSVVYSAYWMPILTFIVQRIYNQEPYSKINKTLNYIFSNRLIMGYQALKKYPIKLFGRPISWSTGISSTSIEEYFYVDSSYLQIALRYGILMLIVICILMTLVAQYANKQNNKYMQISIMLFLAHCMADPQLLSFRYNPFIICFVAALLPEVKLKYKSNNIKEGNNI